SFFPVFNGRWFLFYPNPLGVSKNLFDNSTRPDLAKGLLRGKL
ncbi:hypothetical protein CPC197_2015, partial [Chlamydia psittaci C1/97]